MKPDLGRKIESRQNNQKATQDAHSKDKNFQVDETVFVQNFRGEPKWLEAVITVRTGPVSYTVQIGKEIAKRHVDQILSRKNSGVVLVRPYGVKFIQDGRIIYARWRNNLCIVYDVIATNRHTRYMFFEKCIL